jgi:hypothetical protein
MPTIRGSFQKRKLADSCALPANFLYKKNAHSPENLLLAGGKIQKKIEKGVYICLYALANKGFQKLDFVQKDGILGHPTPVCPRIPIGPSHSPTRNIRSSNLFVNRVLPGRDARKTAWNMSKKW